MALGYAPTQQPVLPVSTPAEGRESRPQRIVLTLVKAVRNLRDERDVQCLGRDVLGLKGEDEDERGKKSGHAERREPG